MTNKICDGCETVAHCLKNVCISKPDIIAMVREAGLAPICEACDVPDVSYAYESWGVELERFAALVAAAEREACAKVCEDDFGNGALNLAAAIRARGIASIRGETK